MFTVPWRSGSGRWGGPPRPWWNIPLKWLWVGAAAPRNGWSRPGTAGCLSPRRQDKKSGGFTWTRGRMERQKVPISKLPSIRPTAVVEMSKCLSICVMELFMCVAVIDLEKQAKDSTKINIYETEGRRHQNHSNSSPCVQKSHISDYKNKMFSFKPQLKVRFDSSAALHGPISAWLVN